LNADSVMPSFDLIKTVDVAKREKAQRGFLDSRPLKAVTCKRLRPSRAGAGRSGREVR